MNSTRSLALFTRLFGAIAIIAILLCGHEAMADSVYVTAARVHFTPGHRSWIAFNVRVPNELSDVSYVVHPGLPVNSGTAGRPSAWSIDRVSSSRLELVVPQDFTKNLSKLRRSNPTLARVYYSLDSWVLEVDYTAPASDPNLTPRAGSTWFETLSDWVSFLNKAYGVANLIDEHGDDLLGSASGWADDLTDAIGDWAGDLWDFLVGAAEAAAAF